MIFVINFGKNVRKNTIAVKYNLEDKTEREILLTIKKAIDIQLRSKIAKDYWYDALAYDLEWNDFTVVEHRTIEVM